MTAKRRNQPLTKKQRQLLERYNGMLPLWSNRVPTNLINQWRR